MVKKTIRKTTKSNKKSSINFNKIFIILILIIASSIIIYTSREALAYYLSFKSEKNTTDARLAPLDEVLDVHGDKAFGIDISEYQDKIYWDKLKTLQGGYPIEFIFIRATVGDDRKDHKFKKYWAKAKERNFVCGAYHYYRPNENSIVQANNFIKNVRLKSGDFPPVLDIEKLPRHQSIDSLKVGLKRWLTKVENHYGVKPIIYSSENYYENFLKDEFEEYPFWIANYSAFYKDIDNDWSIWQITESAKVEGIKGSVDVNVYNGDSDALRELLIK